MSQKTQNTTPNLKKQLLKMDKSKVVLFDIDYTLFNTDVFKETQLKEHSVYDEVHGVLKNLSRVAELGIFSEGETDFQKTKLNNTDIKKYFKEKHVHIALNKKDQIRNILNKYSDKQLVLVDDKLTILYELKRVLPSIFTIWVKRGMYARNQKKISGFNPDATVNNLKEIVSIIHNS